MSIHFVFHLKRALCHQMLVTFSNDRRRYIDRLYRALIAHKHLNKMQTSRRIHRDAEIAFYKVW